MPTIMEQLIEDVKAQGRDDFINDIVSLISDMHLSVSKSISVLDSLGWSDKDKNKLISRFISRLEQIGYIENLPD